MAQSGFAIARKGVRRGSTLVWVALVVASLTGCSVLGIGPGQYDDLKALVKRIDFGAAGSVTHETYYGAGLAGGPSYEAFVIGEDSTERVKAQLVKAGFRCDSNERCRRSGAVEVAVGVSRYSPGDTFTDPSGSTIKVTSPGTLVGVFP